MEFRTTPFSAEDARKITEAAVAESLGAATLQQETAEATIKMKAQTIVDGFISEITEAAAKQAKGVRCSYTERISACSNSPSVVADIELFADEVAGTVFDDLAKREFTVTKNSYEERDFRQKVDEAPEYYIAYFDIHW